MRRDDGDRANLKDLRVLFVEDEDDARELGASALRDSGAEVAEVRTSRSARRFSLVQILAPARSRERDLGLADEDGVELIRQVRALLRCRREDARDRAHRPNGYSLRAAPRCAPASRCTSQKPIDDWLLTHAKSRTSSGSPFFPLRDSALPPAKSFAGDRKEARAS